MAGRSSAQTAKDAISQPNSPHRVINEGPERSSALPAATESLIVRTETRMRLSVLSGGFHAFSGAVALAFVHQAQPFHQQACGAAGNRRARGTGIEIDLEISARPAHRLKNSFFAFEWPKVPIDALPAGEKSNSHASISWRIVSRHDFCPISSDCNMSRMLISSSRP